MLSPTGLADLLDLQAEDSDIDRLLHQRESLPELERYKQAHAAVDKIEKRHSEAAIAMAETARTLDKTSGEMELAEIKLGQEENRLFAGGMSARETEHMRDEVAMLRRNIGTMEDEVLALMESREAQEKALEELGAERDEAAASKAELEAEIKKQWKSIDDDIAKHEGRKADIVPSIPEDLVELYEELRQGKERTAVGRLSEDGTCGVCHLKLSKAEVAEATRSDPPRCLHCRRILVP
ncbi:MAG: hypothetical protein KJN71_01035 [Acidimicrobiia bacterium]|nr:hypothetical protein [Acidimicrobiia bacterium]NNC74096.1 hypothetical protein [Acidimicrobiia bacterium]